MGSGARPGEPVRLAIVGCGGMGLRHLHGLAELRRFRGDDVRLVAVCDPAVERAEALAGEAERLLGDAPVACPDLGAAVRRADGLDGVDVTAGTAAHHALALEAIERGLHVLIEKPLAATVRGCRAVVDAQRRSGLVVAVAENVRREPMHRLAHALLQDGALGAPRLAVEVMSAGAAGVHLTPWRHQRSSGGILLDIGVHHADLLVHHFGPVVEVFGRARLQERVRRAANGHVPSAAFYQRWREDGSAPVAAEVEDLLVASLAFASGATAELVMQQAGRGSPIDFRLWTGSRASLQLPRDRSGQGLVLSGDDHPSVRGDELLDLAPSYRLEPLAADLFGAERPTCYDCGFAEIDRKLVALEVADWVDAIRIGSAPEVDADDGLRAVAVIYAALESARLGRPVGVSEVEAGDVDVYQQPIDAELGLR